MHCCMHVASLEARNDKHRNAERTLSSSRLRWPARAAMRTRNMGGVISKATTGRLRADRARWPPAHPLPEETRWTPGRTCLFGSAAGSVGGCNARGIAVHLLPFVSVQALIDVFPQSRAGTVALANPGLLSIASRRRPPLSQRVPLEVLVSGQQRTRTTLLTQQFAARCAEPRRPCHWPLMSMAAPSSS